MKLLIKLYLLAPKQGKSEILYYFGKQYLTFASNRLFIFSGFIVCSKEWCRLTKNQSLIYFKKTIMSDRHKKVVICIKYGWNTIACAKVMHLGHYVQNVWGVKNPYQQQNLKILSTFQGHKNSYGQKFWNLIFLNLKRQGYIDINRAKINLESYHLHAQILQWNCQ